MTTKLLVCTFVVAVFFSSSIMLGHKQAIVGSAEASSLEAGHYITPVISSLLFEDRLASEMNCPDGPLMTRSPVPLASIRAIMPLGSASPPGHTLPVHHVYFNLTPLNEANYGLGSIATPLVSPGVGELVAVDKNGDNADFNLHIRLCKDVKIYFNHVQSLDADLAQAIGEINASNSMASGSSLMKEVSIPLKSGQALGVVAGPGVTSFDMGVIDTRRPQQAYVRPERYSIAAVLAEALDPPPANYTERLVYNVIPRRLYQFCPVDYFDQSAKSSLEAKFAAYMAEAPALGNPKCQTHMRDVAGTFSGGWFVAENGSQLLMNEEDTFAALPYYANPDIEVFSVPQKLFPALPYDGIWGFTGTESGMINRSFASVNDQQLHCYSGLSRPGSPDTLTGSFLMQLGGTGNTQITIEYISTETCATMAIPWTYKGSELTLYR